MNNTDKEKPDLTLEESNDIDFKEIYYVLSTNLKLIFSIIIISFLLGLVFILTSTPLYKSYGTVLIESNSPGLSLFANFTSPQSSNVIDNEVEILKSKLTLGKTVEYFVDNDLNNNMFLFKTREYEHRGLG